MGSIDGYVFTTLAMVSVSARTPPLGKPRVQAACPSLFLALFLHPGDFPTLDKSQLCPTLVFLVSNCPNVGGVHTPPIHQ